MEPTSQNNGINAIKDAKKLLNECRSNLSHKEIKEIRGKLNKKEVVYNFLKEKEQKGSLRNREQIFWKDLGNLQKYQYNITCGVDYLLNKLDEGNYYEPKEVKSVFECSYVLYEIRGDKDNKLTIYEYFE